MEVYGKTDIGQLRQINQDNYYIEHLDNAVILCVCDGMGGHKSGHIASKYALNVFVKQIKQSIKEDMSDIDIKEMLENAIKKANTFVYDMARTKGDYSDMGTTLIGGILTNNAFYVLNVGDSRCYHIDTEEITQVSKDHSLVQELIDRGTITEEESLTHPQKNVITNAIGIFKKIKSDIYKINLVRDEYILLCSDGLYNQVSDDILKEEILKETSVEEKCDTLVDMANKNGGYDNITTIVLQF